MQMPTPITRDLVLIGGGHTHALVLRMWGMNPVPGVRVTLINPGPVAAYSGMLPGFVAGHYDRTALEIDLVRLARFSGARLIMSRAIGIDRPRRKVQLEGRPEVAFDLLSIDIGVTADMPELPGFDEYGTPAKPLDKLAERWGQFTEAVLSGQQQPEVAVIGGGLAGVELALAARHRLGDAAKVTVIDAAQPLAGVGAGARRALMLHLQEAGIKLLAQSPVQAVTPDGVRLIDGQLVPGSFIIGAGRPKAHTWLTATGVALEDGFVAVAPTLQSTTDPTIFATGDIAHMTHAPRPKAGVFAVRQAPVLHHNLRVMLTGRGALQEYRPQRDYLKLVSTGGKGAVADKWGLPLDGAILWRWKDRIDQRFMEKFRSLPVMQATAAPLPPSSPGLSDRPLCGGCGAKAGRNALTQALRHLPAPTRSDVLTGAGDDAAVLRMGGLYQTITTDHLRAFTNDPWLMARITAIHALGDIWSMGGQPQIALAQVILPLMAEAQQAETLREIMDGAQSVFGPEGADVVGGHTSMGAELTIGFTVTGLSTISPTVQSGARKGDALILTKPIGTGVILAAEMAGLAAGWAVQAALAQMNRPQGQAARVLAPHAHAMTDVTGFGLAGHLMSICDASGLSARIILKDVPVLPGAEDLARAGVGSSLLSANRQVAARMIVKDSALADLLFDPQTAGGLLAAVDASQADAILARLQSVGETAAIIGNMGEGPAAITVES